jgi:hypothetical protein
LHKHQGIGYEDFYDKFYAYMMQDTWFANEIEEARQYYINWMKQGSIAHPNIGNSIEISGLNLHYRIAINFYYNATTIRPHVYAKLREFVDANYPLDQHILDELFRFQQHYLIDYPKRESYPETVEFDYDFVNYLIADKPLNNTVEYRFEFRGFVRDSLDTFCESIYYARRGQFTKARIYTIGETHGFASIDE